MPDITMCEDAECPFAKSCYRFTAEPSRRQSYFTKSPREVNPDGETDCGHRIFHPEQPST